LYPADKKLQPRHQLDRGCDMTDEQEYERWTRPRWMVGELEIETARKLERNKLGKVFDDGDGGPVWWWPFGADKPLDPIP
jgi:hypothetical protein